MSILNINVGISANFCDERIVSKSDFIDLIDIADSSQYLELAYDRGAGLSSLIVFMEDELARYEDQDDPDEELQNSIRYSLEKLTNWLSNQDVDVFDKLKNDGLKVWVFIELWIDDDQLELNFPPELLGECGRLGLSLDVISND